MTDLDKIPVQISKDEADEQQAYSIIPKIERYHETSANKVKTKSLTQMPKAQKVMKERDCTQAVQMPVAKKESTDHKCLWQRKT